jgi:hypothetical protein
MKGADMVVVPTIDGGMDRLNVQAGGERAVEGAGFGHWFVPAVGSGRR